MASTSGAKEKLVGSAKPVPWRTADATTDGFGRAYRPALLTAAPPVDGNSAISSPTDEKRLAGSLARHLATIVRYGSATQFVSGSAVRCFIKISPTLSPSNGTWPVSIS